MRLPKAVPLLLMLTALGCSKPQFVYEADPAFQTRPYRTMAVDPRRDRIIIRAGMRPLNPELHLRAVLTELEARRYRAAPASEADLWVTVYVLIGGQPEDRGGSSHREGSGEGHRGGGRGGAGAGNGPGGGREGSARGTFTVIVQLQDRKTGLPVWQGEAILDHRAKAADGSPLGIEEAVHQLLQPLAARP